MTTMRKFTAGGKATIGRMRTPGSRTGVPILPILICFNNLGSAIDYVFPVRVSITDYLTGSNYLSSWNSKAYGMTTLFTISTKAPPTTGLGTNHAVHSS